MNDAIEINVETEYAVEQSRVGEYVFIYHICIRNNGASAVKLLRRKWLITDSDGRIVEVEGEGVIGEQPSILPESEYRYSSFSMLKTPVGCMQGSYQMQHESGELFDAPIPVFTLAVRSLLQ